MRTNVQGVRTLVLIVVLALTAFRSSSQSITTGSGKIELGLGFGPLVFLGDLGGNYGTGKRFIKDVNLPTINWAKGVYVNVYPAEWIGFRFAINQGKLEGYDSLIRDQGGGEHYRKQRNLQFQSPLWETYGAIELYPTVFLERFDGLFGKLRPYGIMGFGAFHFNPKGRYYDPNGGYKWVDLKPLHLEGQGMMEYPDRKDYKLWSWEIPIGVGFKYYLTDNFYLGMELMHRKSFTDYVDDVSTTYIDGTLFANYLSPEQAAMANQLYFREGFTPGTSNTTRRIPPNGEQRGNPKQNDSFFSTIFRMGWRLNDYNSPNGRALRQLRCPSFY
jgi:hypothetical protein